MKLTYHPEQSKLIELLLVLQYIHGFYTQLDADQSQLLDDVSDDTNAIAAFINAHTPQIRQTMLQTDMPIGLVAYRYLIQKGHTTHTIEEYTQCIQQLTDEDYLQIILDTLKEKVPYTNHEQLYQILEASDTIEETSKWLWFKAIRNPRQHFTAMLQLLQTAEQFYHPFYEKYAPEREAFVKHFSIERAVQQFAFLNPAIVTQLADKPTIFVPLSPWLLMFMLISDSFTSDLPCMLCVGSRIEQATEQKQLSDAVLIDSLKVLADLSRYAVLKELTLPHVKAKDAAEKLKITNAAVSYHTQKLLSSNFLVASIDTQTDGPKYDVNKTLLRNLILKLEADFHLNEE